MRATQSTLIETAHRIQAFLDANAALIGPTITSARQNFDDAVAQLTTMAVTQSGSAIASKGATARTKILRSNLRQNHMKPVAQVAKVILPDVPEAAALTLPTKQLQNMQLVSAAHGMADAADKYSDTFTKNGMPDGFTTDLRSAADAVATSVSGRAGFVQATSGAVKGMLAQESRVRNLLQLIDALVVPKLGTNATLVGMWQRARAITGQKTVTVVPASIAAPPASTTTTTAPDTTTAGSSSTPVGSSSTPVGSSSTTAGSSSTTTAPTPTPAPDASSPAPSPSPAPAAPVAAATPPAPSPAA